MIRTGDDRVQDRIGFRTVATRGPDILLNGKPIFLRGISLHEEALGRGGRATTRAQAEALLNLRARSWAATSSASRITRTATR